MIADGKKQIDSKVLFENQKEIQIIHNNSIYFLRVTKENKLILTK